MKSMKFSKTKLPPKPSDFCMRHMEKTCCCQELLCLNDNFRRKRDRRLQTIFCLVIMKTDESMEQVRNPVMSGRCLSIIMIKEEFSIDNKRQILTINLNVKRMCVCIKGPRESE